MVLGSILGPVMAVIGECHQIFEKVSRFRIFCAPVAQLDRALASGAKGRRFESCRACHLSPLNAPVHVAVSIRFAPSLSAFSP